MEDEEGKKEEEKIEFTPEGETLGYISLDQARILAIEHVRDNTAFYGRRYARRELVWQVVSQQESEDYYDIRLSYQPARAFQGEPGLEQVTVEKIGSIRLRQILSEPVTPRRRIGLPVLLVGTAVIAGILVGVLFASGVLPPSASPSESDVAANAVNTSIFPGAPAQLQSPSGQVTIELAVGAVDIPGLMWYQPLSPGQVPDSPEGYSISDKVFDLSITAPQGASVGPTALVKPITINVRLSVGDTALAGGVESNVVLQRFQQDDDRWEALNTIVDFRSSIARAEVQSLSIFALTIKRPESGDSPETVLNPTATLSVTPLAPEPAPPTAVRSTPVPTPTAAPFPTATPVPTPTPTRAPTPTFPPRPTPTPTPVPIPTPTSTPFPTPTPTRPPTPAPTPVPVVAVETTAVSRQDSPLGLRIGSRSNSTQLTTTCPQGSDAPVPEGTGFYGLLPAGISSQLGVMVDLISFDENRFLGTAYFGTFNDGRFANAQERVFERNARSGDIIILVDYGEESEFVSFWVDLFARSSGSTTSTDIASVSISANLYTNTMYVARVPGSSTYFIIDSTGSGRFDTPQTRVIQDVDHDGFIFDSVTGEVQTSVDAVIVARDDAWRVDSISPSGREVRLTPTGKGTLSGTVQTFLGAESIADATIQVWPGPFETVSLPDGSYSLEAHSGEVWKMLVKKKGYVPFSYYGGTASERREPVASGDRILIRQDRNNTYDVELAEIPDVRSGTARFNQNGSFHGALGLAVTDATVGDFDYQIYQDIEYTLEDEIRLAQGLEAQGTVRTNARICACYEGQRGIVELGDYGSRALELLPIPPIGYVTQQRLELIPGSVYVSKAREGLEGHFVVFRVDSISESAASVTYLFR